MSWDQDAYARSIVHDIAKLKPLGDFLLVKPFTVDEQLALEDRRIAPSPIQMTRDGRYVANRPRGLRYGRVVAMGAGDRVIGIVCKICSLGQFRIERGQDDKKWRCSGCGGFDLFASSGFDVQGNRIVDSDEACILRAPLGCTLGDVILFPRVPANELAINGEEFVFIHEEQHCVAVIEELEAVAA